MENPLSRRDVLRNSLMMAGVPYMCCDTEPVPAEAVGFEPGRVVIDLRRAPGLLRTGASGKIVDTGRGVRLIVSHVDRKRYVAHENKCSHGGGWLAYSHKRRTVQCTCWGHSEFALNGSVVGGPAKRPIRQFATSLKDNRLEIALEAES